ncbi:MAG: histidine kinase [Clostridiaceae bacterium]|nr:histidine kinase [Clostridiaceae bacterium]
MKLPDLRLGRFQTKQLISVFLRRVAFFLVLILIPVLITSVGFIIFTNRTLDDETEKMNEAALAQAKNISETIFSNSRLLCASISSKSDIGQLMTPSYSLVDFNMICDDLRNQKFINAYIYSIEIYSHRNMVIVTPEGTRFNADTRENEWCDYIDYTNEDMKTVVYARNQLYPYVFGIIKPVIIEEEAAQGAVATLLDLSKISETINMSTYARAAAGQPSREFFILDENFNIISSNQLNLYFKKNIYEVLNLPNGMLTAEPGSSIINDGKVISLLQSEQFPLYYLAVSSTDYRYSFSRDTQRLLLIIFVLAILFSIVVTIVISYKSVSLIDQVIATIKNPHGSSMRDKDLQTIADLIEQSSDEVFKTELESRIFMLQQVQASSLQAQMNPHFLHNTLDTINWMAFMDLGGKNRVSAALINLSNLLQYSIYGQNFTCSLHDEVEHAKAYVDLLNLRYQGRFIVEFAINPELENATVVRFLLQPLIENAVYHGLKPLDIIGHILIRTRVSDQDLILTVEDDGLGINPEKAAELNTQFDANAHLKKINETAREALLLRSNKSRQVENDKNTHGVGISNIDMRIKLIFGIHYGISIEPGASAGTIVIIRMPLRSDS